MTLHPVQAYIHGAIDGSIPACKAVRLAVERQLRDLETGAGRDLHFDRAAAQHVIEFFGFLCHSKGKWAGQPFILEGWELFILWVVFGWKRADGTRRFRTVYIEVPRKNGKTTFVAGIGLYLLSADGEPGAEIYAAATKRDQAKLTWDEAREMRLKSPALSKLIQVYKSSSTLVIEKWRSKFVPLGADQDTQSGLNVHGALIDEVHEHKSRAMIDILRTAMGARRQPIQIETTTAGYDRQSVCYEHHEYSREILENTIQDDTWFTFMSYAEDGSDWTDPSVWAQVNPNYGITVNPDDLIAQRDQAKRMPSAQNTFRRFHLCQWTQQSNRWIDVALWNENAGVVDEGDLEGRLCYGGLDLSSVSDLTAWVMVFPHDDDPEALDILARFWCPEDKLTDDGNRYQAQYQVWARDGWLQTTPGSAVDYGFVKKQILEDAGRFQLIDLNIDRLFQAYGVSQELQDEGLTVYGMGQGFMSFAPLTKEFEKRLLLKKLHHGNNPILTWMADNVAVSQDPAGNLKPDKAASQGKIDGVVALLMALDRAMRREKPKRSVYEDHGLESA